MAFTHAPLLQAKPPAHSVDLLHVARQAVPASSHRNGEHDLVASAGQPPEPLHEASSVATPSLQEAGRHFTSAPESAAHLLASLPSHVVASQVVPPPVPHARRFPWGAPLIATHLPMLPVTSHA